jgi:hypothetical protein
VCQDVSRAGGTTIIPQKTLLLLSLLLLPTLSARAQGKKPKAPAVCTGEIPVGVKVVRLPEAEQRKVTLSAFNVSPAKDSETYDLAMRIKNGTAWCLTSLALTYELGDARGQQWVANEYPAVMEFKTHADPPKTNKTAPANPSGVHSVGMPPGQEETRILFDLYNYIQPRPAGFFDGFHLISAEVKYCMGYLLSKSP